MVTKNLDVTIKNVLYMEYKFVDLMLDSVKTMSWARI